MFKNIVKINLMIDGIINRGIPLQIGISETEIKHIIVDNHYCKYHGKAGDLSDIICDGLLVEEILLEHDKKTFVINLSEKEINYPLNKTIIQPINIIKKVYGYCRESQNDRVENIEGQIIHINEYCKDNDIVIIKIEQEIGTARPYDANLPKRRILVELCQKSKIPIMVTFVDRFTRNYEWFIDVYDADVRIISLDNPKYTYDDLIFEAKLAQREPEKWTQREEQKQKITKNKMSIRIQRTHKISKKDNIS
jgi:hypothetical protein